MDKSFRRFEMIARKAHRFTQVDARQEQPQHPFETRNIHEVLPDSVQDLFDDGHYAQATFEAFKYVDKVVQKLASTSKSGCKAMMEAFSDTSPVLSLTPNHTNSERDEQRGYQFIFAGSILAIRNPRGHEVLLKDSPDACLDHLAFASMLLRRLELSGYDVAMT